MVKIEGKYTLEKQENFSEYLKELGLSEDKIQGALAVSKDLDVKVNGDDYTLTSGLGSRTYPLGKEIDENLPDGNTLKSTASLDGSKLTIKSTGADGKPGQRVYEFSDNGLELTLSGESTKTVAKQFYKRA